MSHLTKLSDFYWSIFGCKTYKISLDAGCSCPNRDGSKGRGGCIFCSQSGSGDYASNRLLSIREQVEEGKKMVQAKVSGRSGKRMGKYIAYFQNFSSTYGNAESLIKKYMEALSCPDVEGLAIATRADCLDEEMLSSLAEISKKHFVQLELGLQTSNEKTAERINRCHTNQDYIDAVSRIKKASPDIHIVSHLIFGLPGENENDMMDSVRFVLQHNSKTNGTGIGQYFGLKITVLYVLENTALAQMYRSGDYIPLTKEEYFLLLEKALHLLPPNCIVHRLTGDPPKKLLLAPAWTADKKRVLNEIKKIF